MAKALKIIGMVVGAVALVATGVGAFAAAGSALAATAGTVATWAGLAAGVANIGSQLLAKPPQARGSVTQVMIAPDVPAPYAMGEGLFAGVMRYQRSYGATLNKVPNPYRFMVNVYSTGGPVESVTPYVDQGTISGWYSGFLYTDVRLGACPDTALAPHWGGAPGWSGSSKLSGKAAIGWSLLFDKDGKRFASGMPQTGAYGKWAKVYDPRLDSTFPGGSGAHRLGNEATYTWSENPALHAGTYAYGRYQNGKRVMGMGLPADAIDWACIAAWANVCEANNWTLFGVVFEPGDRFANLRDICAAGGGEPILRSSPLSFHYPAPRVALDTITAADIARSEARSVTPTARYAERVNTVFPKYRSPAHNWELVPADPVSISAYVTADGEVKQAEWPFNLVKDATQATQLARYRLEDSREFQPIVLPCHPRLRGYPPGTCLQLDLLEELGLSTKAVILKRRFDHARGIVILTLIGETSAKHGYALGMTGAAPITPTLGQTGEDRDKLMAAVTGGGAHQLAAQSIAFPLNSNDNSITISAFTGTIEDGRVIAFSASSITGLASGSSFAVVWDLIASTYSAIAAPATTALANPNFVFLGWMSTSSAGTFPAAPPPPAGWGGSGSYNDIP